MKKVVVLGVLCVVVLLCVLLFANLRVRQGRKTRKGRFGEDVRMFPVLSHHEHRKCRFLVGSNSATRIAFRVPIPTEKWIMDETVMSASPVRFILTSSSDTFQSVFYPKGAETNLRPKWSEEERYVLFGDLLRVYRFLHSLDEDVVGLFQQDECFGWDPVRRRLQVRLSPWTTSRDDGRNIHFGEYVWRSPEQWLFARSSVDDMNLNKVSKEQLKGLDWWCLAQFFFRLEYERTFYEHLYVLYHLGEPLSKMDYLEPNFLSAFRWFILWMWQYPLFGRVQYLYTTRFEEEGIHESVREMAIPFYRDVKDKADRYCRVHGLPRDWLSGVLEADPLRRRKKL